MLLALGVVSMVSLIVAGATSLISLADRIHPVAGTVVFWGLCLAAGFLALYCVIARTRSPAPEPRALPGRCCLSCQGLSPEIVFQP